MHPDRVVRDTAKDLHDTLDRIRWKHVNKLRHPSRLIHGRVTKEQAREMLEADIARTRRKIETLADALRDPEARRGSAAR